MLSPFRNVLLPIRAERHRLPARWAFREVAQWLARSDLARIDWNIETQTHSRQCCDFDTSQVDSISLWYLATADP